MSNLVRYSIYAVFSMTLLACGGSGGSAGNNSNPPGRGSQPIGPKGGSKTSGDGKATVVIPPGALSQELDITVELASNSPAGNIGNAYEFRPDGTSFSQPVAIDIAYDPVNLPSGTNTSELRLGKVVNNRWEIVPGSSVDTALSIVSGETNSFSVYGILPFSETALSFMLTIESAGEGSGTIASAPPGIDCGLTCSAIFDSEENVTLIASSSGSSIFSGWSGDPDCIDGSITMSADKTCIATFDLPVISGESLFWAKKAGGAGVDFGKDVASFPDGSFVVTGDFEGTATFGTGESNETSLTSTDFEAFIARYGTDGTLMWAKQVANNVNTIPDGSLNRDIASFSDGTFILVGSFSGTATFGAGEVNETILTSAGSHSVFIARYNADGTLAWAKNAGSSSQDHGHGIASISDGSSVVTGIFTDSATFGAGEENETTLISTSAGSFQVFVARYNANGTLAWAKQAGLVFSTRISSLQDGSSVVAGFFFPSEPAIFGVGEANETTLTAAVGSIRDIFLARYNPDGTLAWAKQAGGTGEDAIDGIDALPEGGFVVTGLMQETTTFGRGEVNEITLTAKSFFEIFVARYYTNGTLAWAKNVGGDSSDSSEGRGIASFSDGTIVVTGSFNGTAKFGLEGTNETILTAQDQDIFIAKFSPSYGRRLFFNSGSISMVDSNNPSVAPVVIEGAETQEAKAFLYGDASELKVSDFHVRSIIYGNKDDGKLYKIGALTRDATTPIQVSSETEIAAMCDAHRAKTEEDWVDHNRSVYIYKTPGDDENCGTEDDVFRMVRLNMTADDPPIAAKEILDGITNQTNGGIAGFLAIEGNKVVRCNQDFQDCRDIISFTSHVGKIEDFFNEENTFLWVDNKIYHYKETTEALSLPLHTFSSGIPSSVLSAADATRMYIADGDQIFEIPMNGSNPSTLFVTESGSIFKRIRLTSSSLIYDASTVALPVLSTIKAVDKATKITTTLVPPTTDTVGGIFPSFMTGDFDYYFRISPTGPSRGLIKDDGTEGSELPNAFWSGVTTPSSSFEGISMDRLVWIDGCSTSSCAGGTLKSFDAATNSDELVLGTIPSDISRFFAFAIVGMNEGLLGAGNDDTGGEEDIFYLNPNQPGSLVRVTSSTDFSESPIR